MAVMVPTICAAAPKEGTSLWVQWTLSKHRQPSIVSFAGEVGFANAGYIGATFRSLLPTNPHRLIFDLTGVRFLDAAGWRALRAARRQAARRCVRLDVVCSGPIPDGAAGDERGVYATIAEALDDRDPRVEQVTEDEGAVRA